MHFKKAILDHVFCTLGGAVLLSTHVTKICTSVKSFICVWRSGVIFYILYHLMFIADGHLPLFHALYVNTIITVTMFPVLGVLGDWATTHLRSALQPSLLLQVAGCHRTRTIQPEAGFLAQFVLNYLDVSVVILLLYCRNNMISFKISPLFHCHRRKNSGPISVYTSTNNTLTILDLISCDHVILSQLINN